MRPLDSGATIYYYQICSSLLQIQHTFVMFDCLALRFVNDFCKIHNTTTVFSWELDPNHSGSKIIFVYSTSMDCCSTIFFFFNFMLHTQC